MKILLLPFPKTSYVVKIEKEEIIFNVRSKSWWYSVPINLILLFFFVAGLLGFIKGTNHFNTLIYLFILIFSFGTLLMIIAILWQIAGREIIKVSASSITIIERLFYNHKVSVYDTNKIVKMRVDADIPNYVWGYDNNFLGLKYILFSYGAKNIYGENKVRMGGGLNEKDAQKLIDTIHEHGPYYKES